MKYFQFQYLFVTVRKLFFFFLFFCDIRWALVIARILMVAWPGKRNKNWKYETGVLTFNCFLRNVSGAFHFFDSKWQHSGYAACVCWLNSLQRVHDNHWLEWRNCSYFVSVCLSACMLVEQRNFAIFLPSNQSTCFFYWFGFCFCFFLVANIRFCSKRTTRRPSSARWGTWCWPARAGRRWAAAKTTILPAIANWMINRLRPRVSPQQPTGVQLSS